MCTLCEVLLPSTQALPSQSYIDAIQRALRMPQSRLIPFFGIFLRDLYAIVNDLPNIVVIDHDDDKEKVEPITGPNSEDKPPPAVGGLLNPNKINLVAIVLDNLELFHRHSHSMTKLVEERYNKMNQNVATSEVKGYEPVQTISGSLHRVHLIPLNTVNFDLDVIQRLQHGTTVIHYDPDSGRSVLCLMRLDYSCSAISWHKISYAIAKDPKDKESASSKQAMTALPTTNIDSAKGNTLLSSYRVQGTLYFGLEEGELKLSLVKGVEPVDSYDLDIESIYHRHSTEEMSVPVCCWKINFGMLLSENEFLYFLAPQQVAQFWTVGLQEVVRCLKMVEKYPDRRMIWIKNLYLQLCKETSSESGGVDKVVGPKPYDALQAFGGCVEKWKCFGLSQAGTSSSHSDNSSLISESGGTRSRLKNLKNVMQKKLRGSARESSRSESPQSQSTLVVKDVIVVDCTLRKIVQVKPLSSKLQTSQHDCHASHSLHSRMQLPTDVDSGE
ncbi:hypothetical protein DICVIV_10955 [Dictyocaulus viviparus]|uniref:Uncharacterized protein n=1 Tax=Dictyocaulus viviparus TaxID=29172 RepID=A0A0D8XEM4_DICVI|nr:hypothetical protein DICVIV_10955 [Dictyocaulus viviparus]